MRFPRHLRFVPSLGISLLCSALLAAGGPARAQTAPVIYRWIDEQGIAHYTANLDRVPRAVRGNLEVVQPEPAAPTPAADAAWVTRDAAPGGSAAGVTGRADTHVEPSSGGRAAPATASTASTGAAGASAHGKGSASPAASSADSASLDTRIASLADAVERDEEAIKTMLAEAPTDGAPALRERADFRTIAQRLPRLQSDLRSLRDQRDRLDGR